MHIDHQIVFRAPDLFEQIEEAQRGAPSLAGLREIASREENDIRERGMMTDDLRVLGRNQPVNAGTGITCIVCTTSPSAEGLISKMRENSAVWRSEVCEGFVSLVSIW
jgi:hypothetical protein